MAKRFTDSEKYKKPFYRSLQGAYKLFWDYICNDCNHAGIWIVDMEVAQIYLGADMPVNKDDALKFFNEKKVRVIELDGGARWFILSFIEFQYGDLNPQNRAHSSVVTQLKSYDLWDDKKNTIKPLVSPSQGAMDKDKEKDKDKDKGEGAGKTICPVDDSFIPVIERWVKYKRERKESYKTDDSLSAMCKKLVKLSGGDAGKAMEIVEQSMANNWAGLFELKTEKTNGRSGLPKRARSCSFANPDS